MDLAFERGAGGRAEIFLPWATFGQEVRVQSDYVLDHPSSAALKMASEHHPTWSALTNGQRLPLGRNAHVMMGKTLAVPAAFVVGWESTGSLDGAGISGGTAHALRIAAAHGIEVFNLQRPEHRARIESILGEEA